MNCIFLLSSSFFRTKQQHEYISTRSGFDAFGIHLYTVAENQKDKIVCW